MKRDPKKFTLLGLLLGAVALLSSPIAQAQINTGLEYGAGTGLGGGDIRTTIARIIQVFLGILGIVALVLIVYAGFLWMTAGGDEEKVTKAKKIMAQAVIGLVIILSSFAITSFVVSRLVNATTGTGGPGGGGGGPGGPLPSGQFAAQSITPPDSKAADFEWPKNSQIRVILKNGSPDPATTAGSISVTANGAPVSGTIAASGNALVFAATAKCVEDPRYTCLPGNAAVSVQLSPALRSLTGKSLYCGLCSAVFNTSDKIDVEDPKVSIATPANGQGVPANSFVPVVANASDDYAVAEVEFSAADVSLGSAGVEPWQVDWDTTGVPQGTNVTLKATATDAVGNTALATPVTVTVRPAHCFNGIKDGDETGLNCGGSCGSCPGGSCSENSDCASGLCVGGQCIARPRIDSVAPTSGGPGTLVTIKGASFGSGPGEVLFLGADAAGDEKTAAPCAPSAWSDTQIVVMVPDGAATGPIQVTNRDNRSDRTDDDFGNASIPDFTVNTQVRPGICILTPSSGPVGTPVAIAGTGFGDTQGSGSVSVAGRSAAIQTWSSVKVAMTVPNLLGGLWPVSVTAGGVDSNSVLFSVPISGGGAPHLLSVDPDSGPIGQYLTILGSNFGNTPGKIEFSNGPDTVLGDVDFPPACGRDWWRTTSVTVKVPVGLLPGNLKIKLVRADAVASDNELDFEQVAGTPSPGICRLDPASGPVGIPYALLGERLGSDKGKVFFRDNVEATSLISSWNASRVSGAVPAKSVTGRVYAVSAAAGTSNSLNFTVADCRKVSVCTGSDECCGDGACRPPNVDGSSGCQAPKLGGSYRYRFSTGDVPLTPAVVEEVTCAIRSQSPSPYKSVTSACVNSIVSARFTVGMDKATLNAGNFTVTDCGNAAAWNAGSCQNAVAGTVSSVVSGLPLEDTIIFTPTDRLKQNEWYLSKIAKGVKSVSGIPLEDDYTWHFRVKNSSDSCAIESITVTPAVNRLSDLYQEETRDGNENITYSEYKANPADMVCNVLNCSGYAWKWRSDTSAAGIVNALSCTPEAQALGETPPAVPATITASAEDKAGDGTLAIRFVDPQVIAYWPNCDTACLQAEIAASFNTALDPATVNSDTMKIFRCANETCARFVEEDNATVSYRDGAANGTLEHLAVVSMPSGLAKNTFYRVMAISGANGVKSTSGAWLIGNNYEYSIGGAPTATFSWVFRTGDKDCAVSTVQVSPDKVVTNKIGSYHGLTAVPKTAPDACALGGQRIDVNGLVWSWSVVPAPPNETAASLYAGGTLNVKPLASKYATSNCLNTGTIAGVSVCGNAKKEKGEECDDGNIKNGDGCSDHCLFEGFPSTTCGNNKIDTITLVDGTTVSEQCDDGNKIDGDGCSSKCLREGSPYGPNPSTCGNNDIADNEQCDDGNTVAGDGCSSICTDEGSKPGPFSVCGNGGSPEAGEDCDLGSQNGVAGSGCSVICLSTGPRPTGSTWLVEPPSVCGDGQEGVGETYDPGHVGDRIDATQYAKAEGKGNTLDKDGKMVSKITASVGGKSGQAEFDLQCGYKSDENCPNGTRLGANSCCYPPANASIRSPLNGEVNVCRNPLIEVEFDREMDAASFVGKFIVGGPIPAAGCSADKKITNGLFHGLWARVSSFVAKVIEMITGKEVNAAPPYCQVVGSVSLETRLVGGEKHSFARFALTSALEANKEYKAVVDQSVKTINGVPLGSPVAWTFVTGADICTLDELTIDPPTKLFTQTYSGTRSDESDQDFVATPNHLDASGDLKPIAPVPGVYDWQVNWISSDKTLVNGLSGDPPAGTVASVGVKKAENGEVTLTAGAKITADKLNKQPTVDRVVANEADITVMLCKNPWPARKQTANGISWAPAPDPNNVYNYNFFYCRDGSNGEAKLPALKEDPAIPANTAALKKQGPTIDQYLYTYVDPKLASEGMGIRVALNPKHLSPAAWYADQGFKGAVKSLKVDGYEAIQDGQTVYVSAPAIILGDYRGPSGDGYTNIYPLQSSFTNIYILSATTSAGADTQNIFNQILKNIRFAANRDNRNGNYIYSDLNFCASSPAIACASNLDCPSGQCLVMRSKIRRDVKRLSDVRLIAEAAQSVKTKTGTYPSLISGTFIPGQTLSVWPSWTKEFAQELGGSPPVDPINKLAKCDDYSADGTCWSPSKQAAFCGAYSSVYGYRYPQAKGRLYQIETESSAGLAPYACDMTTQASCDADPLCVWRSEAGAFFCDSRVSVNICANTVIGANPSVCGNGSKEVGEACEKGETRTIACAGNGREVDACGPDCQWVVGACQAPKCGNGVKEGNEICDQGALNGTYGHCNAACYGIGASCGDGVLQQGEVCDLGAGNGAYPADGAEINSCAWDCHSRGEWCGDHKTNGGEQCDGNSLTSIDALGSKPVCPPDGTGHEQTYSISCASGCTWGFWSDTCSPAGTCGNGKVDSAQEQCDNGSGNSDTGSCTTSCKLSVCGDANVWTGHEQCDNGAGNMSSTDQARIDDLKNKCSLASCYYCSTACVPTAVSGRYCGDNKIDADLGEQCEIGGRNTKACTKNGYDGTATQTCDGKCKWNAFGACATGSCGDGEINGGEQCDLGAGNGVINSGCSGSCVVCYSTQTTIVSDTTTMVDGHAAVPTSFSAWPAQIAGATWIWSAAVAYPPDIDIIKIFTKDINLPGIPSSASLDIAADDAVTIKLNGNEVCAGVASYCPGNNCAANQTINHCDIQTFLKQGNNTFEFTVKNFGQPENHYNPEWNPAGLLYKVQFAQDCSR